MSANWLSALTGVLSVWPSTRRIQLISGGIWSAISRITPATRATCACPAGPSVAEPGANSTSEGKTKRSPTTCTPSRSPRISRICPKNSER